MVVRVCVCMLVVLLLIMAMRFIPCFGMMSPLQSRIWVWGLVVSILVDVVSRLLCVLFSIPITVVWGRSVLAGFSGRLVMVCRRPLNREARVLLTS